METHQIAAFILAAIFSLPFANGIVNPKDHLKSFVVVWAISTVGLGFLMTSGMETALSWVNARLNV